MIKIAIYRLLKLSCAVTMTYAVFVHATQIYDNNTYSLPNKIGSVLYANNNNFTKLSALSSMLQSAPIKCQTFDDGYSSMSGLSDAIYIKGDSSACTPNGGDGTCRKWFGRCVTTDSSKLNVLFKVHNNGESSQTNFFDAVYMKNPGVSCVPGGPDGECRRWFGLPQTQDGRAVVCRLFDDGYTNMTGPTRSIYYRSPSQVCMPDGSSEGTCRKWFGRCEVDSGGPPILPGKLYREVSRPEIYLIMDGKKVWIPTPDALLGSGYTWNQVIVVNDGALSSYQRYDIKSLSNTPGSLLFPAGAAAPGKKNNRRPLYGINTSQRVMSQGIDVQLVELRGWIYPHSYTDGCGGDYTGNSQSPGYDFAYSFELDTDWAIGQGIDLHKVLRVGNFYLGHSMMEGSRPRRSVVKPIIKIELNSWNWGRPDISPPLRNAPADWIKGFSTCPEVSWPFNPTAPSNNVQLKGGEYVSVYGSILGDSPHEEKGLLGLPKFGTIFDSLGWDTGSEYEWTNIVPLWHPNVSVDSPEHYARWTEIHPPDKIEIISGSKKSTTAGVMLMATPKFSLGSKSCESISYDLYPESNLEKPSVAELAYQELVGPESDYDSNICEKTITNRGNHININIKMCVNDNLLPGVINKPAKFKAIYRVWWVSGKRSCSNDTIRAGLLDVTYLEQNCDVANSDTTRPQVVSVKVDTGRIINGRSESKELGPHMENSVTTDNDKRYTVKDTKTQGQEYEVTVWATDPESGIKSIELASLPSGVSQPRDYNITYMCSNTRPGSQINPVLEFYKPNVVLLNNYQEVINKMSGKLPNWAIAKFKFTVLPYDTTCGTKQVNKYVRESLLDKADGFIRVLITNGKGIVTQSGTLLYDITPHTRINMDCSKFINTPEHRQCLIATNPNL